MPITVAYNLTKVAVHQKATNGYELPDLVLMQFKTREYPGSNKEDYFKPGKKNPFSPGLASKQQFRFAISSWKDDFRV